MKKILYIFLLVISVLSYGQTPYRPTQAEIMVRYAKARILDSLATRSIFRTSVLTHWQHGDRSFWYQNILKDSVQEYVYVDIAKGTRVKVSRTFIDSLRKDSAQGRPYFERSWSRWADFHTDSISPDRQYSAYIKDGNVFIRPINGGEAIQYTSDGNDNKPYGELAWSPDST